MGIEWDNRPPHAPPGGAETPDARVAASSRRAAWRTWAGALAVSLVLDRVVALTIPLQNQLLWRLLLMLLVVVAAAGYFRLSAPAARAPRLLMGCAALAFCGVYALMEVFLTALPSDVVSGVRLAGIIPLSAATVVVFNRITTRLILRDAAERHALERAHADALRLEGVLLAARTMQHRLNNALSTTTGFAELLANDPSLTAEARGRALVVLESAREASRQLLAIARVTRVEEDARYDVPVLDVERSIGGGGAGQAPERRDESITR